MIAVFETIRFRNETLFYFGTICLAFTLILFIVNRFSALQILPILAYCVFKDVRLTFFVALLYRLLAVWTLILALRGKSLF
jgi:hypothetical protein